MLYCFLVLLDPYSQELLQSLLVDVLDLYSTLYVASSPAPSQLFSLAGKKDRGAWGRGYVVCACVSDFIQKTLYCKTYKNKEEG